MEMFHGIPKETIVSKEDGKVVLKVQIPASSDYFDGHFPEFKLLPAVAQIDLTAHFASEYFGSPLPMQGIKRLKFSDKILPDSVVLFKIQLNNGKITFEIRSEDESVLYSAGSYTVSSPAEKGENA